MLHGFLNVCKPRGLTSHDVVARARRIVGQRRIGHAGTLDPLAEGVLPLALGRATRLVERVGAGEKTYCARLRLGIATTSGDAEGEVISSVPAPDFAVDQVQAVLRSFQGGILQVPPAFSAVKVRGRRAYELARRGQAVELAPRHVQIYELRLVSWANPDALLWIRCSRGTYVRSLARDIGEALGCGGHLAGLVRVAVGPFHLSWALGLDDLERAASSGALDQVCVAADVALLDLPAYVVADERDADFMHGRAWRAEPSPSAEFAGEARAYTASGRLLGLMHYDSSDGRWQPRLALLD